MVPVYYHYYYHDCLVPKTPSPYRVRVVSTYGSDSDLVNIVTKFEPELASSPSLSFYSSNPDLSTSATKTPTNKRLFQFVKKTGSSLRNKLVKNKHMALNKTKHRTLPCNRKNCQCCKQISDKDSYKINGKIVKSSAGSCITYNIIYCVHCKICDKNYVGRSIQQLNERIGQHRRHFYEMLKDINAFLSNDLYRSDENYSLGFHLIENHNLCDKFDFAKTYEVFILDTCSPFILEVQEHKYIQLLKSLKPHGLNAVDPFGIPILRLCNFIDTVYVNLNLYILLYSDR